MTYKADTVTCGCQYRVRQFCGEAFRKLFLHVRKGRFEVFDNVLRFWKKHAHQKFNDRQQAMIERLFKGFEGKLTSSKWAQTTKSSQDTALRDIDDLIARDVLAKDAAGGRSTSYSLVAEVETDQQAWLK